MRQPLPGWLDMWQLPPNSRIRRDILPKPLRPGLMEAGSKPLAVILHHHHEMLALPFDFQPQFGGARMFDGIVKCFLDGHQQASSEWQISHRELHVRIHFKYTLNAERFQELLGIVTNIIGKVPKACPDADSAPKGFHQCWTEPPGPHPISPQVASAPWNSPATRPGRLRR